MTTYSNYFAVRDGYYPVVSKESIEGKTDQWQDTYPHKTFIDLLKKTERLLARNSAQDKKPLWIHGAYGTGKSRIAWALGEILQCSNQELIDYFAKYKELQDQEELREKLLGHKAQGKIVVATRYISSDINSMDTLIVAVYEGINAALEKQGLQVGEKSLSGAMLNWLKDKDNREYMTALLNKEETRPLGSCGGMTGEQVRAKLQEESEHPAFLSDLLQVARKAGIRSLSFDMDTLLAWIKEVIEINQLKALFFLWDEFSDYFRLNIGNLGGFQRLAEASVAMPFELCIVTHFAESILPEKEQSSKVVRDRFTLQPIELPDYTAFKLIANAFHTKPEHAEEWKGYQKDLNEQLEEARNAVHNIVPALHSEDFMDILPFHPYAALILKNIAKLFDSNQRSLFEFISNKDEKLHAFQWFIANHDPNKKQFLTIDMLWDYFYQADKGGIGQGRNTLDQSVREIMDCYPSLEKKPVLHDPDPMWNEKARKVLKTVIILQALSQKAPRSPEFQATEKNLMAAFNGQENLEHSFGIAVADDLVKRKVLFKDRTSNNEPIYQIVITDPICNDLEILKDEIRKSLKTRELIKEFRQEDILTLTPPLRERFSFRITSTETPSFKSQYKNLLEEKTKGYKMKAMLICARDERELRAVPTMIQEVIKDPSVKGVIYILAETILDEDTLDAWTTFRAKAICTQNQNKKQSEIFANEADEILKRWGSEIHNGKFRLWSSTNPESMLCANGSAVLKAMQHEVETTFSFCFDFLRGMTEALFKVINKNALLAAMEQKEGGTVSRAQSEELLRGVKGIDNYKEICKDRPLAKLKTLLDAEIEKNLKTGRASIQSIIDFLLKQGFMPTLLSAYLTAFLMKEYAVAPYRYSDGHTGDTMKPDKMAEMIKTYFGTLRGVGSTTYRDQYIVMLTEEQWAFVKLSQKVFQLGENKSISIESIVQQIIAKVKNYTYPLWCLESLPEYTGLEDFIEKYSLLLNPTNSKGATSGGLASEIGRLILDNPDAEEGLCQIITKESCENAMRLWLKSYEDGDFWKTAQEINVVDVLADVRRTFSTDGVWLWNKETGVKGIHSLFKGYLLINASIERGFITIANSMDTCYAAWQEKIRQIRIPCVVLQEKNRELIPFLNLLLDIAKEDKLVPESKQDSFYEWITEKTQSVHEFFANCRYLFRSIYQNNMEGLSEEDKNRLYTSMDMISFQMDKAKYERVLDDKITEIRSKTFRKELCEIWQQHTETASPAEWSKQHKTPLPALFPQEQYKEMKVACDAVNNADTPIHIVEESLHYFLKHQEFFEQMKEINIDEAFKKAMLPRYDVILKDLDQVRDHLIKEISEDVYSWMENPAAQRAVEDLAKAEYEAHGLELVAQKIEAMDPAEAKNYLKQLVLREFEVGIKILSE